MSKASVKPPKPQKALAKVCASVNEDDVILESEDDEPTKSGVKTKKI